MLQRLLRFQGRFSLLALQRPPRWQALQRPPRSPEQQRVLSPALAPSQQRLKRQLQVLTKAWLLQPPQAQRSQQRQLEFVPQLRLPPQPLDPSTT
jgi:hypothetical protein